MCLECCFEHGSECQHVSSRPTVDALRVVLIAGIDRDVAASAMGCGTCDSLVQWPSGIYAALAHAATTSPIVWQRCRTLLDATFGEVSDRFAALPASEVAQCISEGRSALSVFELSAMIWALLRRSQTTLDRVISRLGAELEVVAFARPQRRRSGARSPALPVNLLRVDVA